MQKICLDREKLPCFSILIQVRIILLYFHLVLKQFFVFPFVVLSVPKLLLAVRIALYTFLLCTTLLKAQQPVLRNFNTTNGLPSNEVYYLHADKKGYIWICTDAGLVKYNGNTFKNFTSANGLPDNTIFEVKEGSDGKIWFRSFSGKVGYILNDSVYTIKANDKIGEFAKSGLLCSFSIDEKGTLYVGRRSPESISFLKINPPYGPDNTIEIWKNEEIKFGICVVGIGSSDFVFSDRRLPQETIDAPTYQLRVYNEKHETLYSSGVDLKVPVLFTRVFRGPDAIYIGLDKMVKKISIRDGSVTSDGYEDLVVTVVSPDGKMDLIGTHSGGIKCAKNEFYNSTFDNILQGLTFTYAIKDYQGGYWFSTLGSGVYYTPAQVIKFWQKDDQGSENIFKLFKFNDSTFFISYQSGTLNEGIISTSEKIELRELYIDKAKTTGEISVVYCLNDTRLLLSGSYGSVLLNRKTGEIKKLYRPGKENLVLREFTAGNKNLLAIRLVEIFQLSVTGNDPTINAFKSVDRLSSITYDSLNNSVYLGGLHGLYRFYDRSVTEHDKLLGCRVEDVKAVSGVLYIASNTEGLIVKRGLRYDTINERKGLISNVCRYITADNNGVWVSTNKGVSKICFSGQSVSQINNFPLSDFIGAKNAGRICIMKDKMFFCSGPGIYSFDRIQRPSPTLFYISSIKAGNERFKPDSVMMFRHDQSNITIELEALLYNCQNNISYRYHLKKDENDWHYTSETTLNFPNLGPGEYEFEAEAKSNNGPWVKADKKLRIKIARPVWLRSWFIALEIVAGMMLVILFLRFRYNQILKKERTVNEIKTRMNELETKAIKSQMNPHFIFNSLNSIQQFILSEDNDNAYRYLSKFAKLVRKLLESTTNEDLSLEDEIDLLTRYIEIESLRFQDAFAYEINVDPKLYLKSYRIPHMLVQPFVENAIWHGLLHKKGERKLTISFLYLDEKCISCLIEDNGVGRLVKFTTNSNYSKKSLAIEFIKKRLDLIDKIKGSGCGFRIIDKEIHTHHETGTIVELKIPIL
jgi:hypothetical protein